MDTCLFKWYFCISRVTVYVCANWGEGASARFLAWEFALRVIFLKKFYQWSYIYLKTFDCETFFCPGDIWRYNSRYEKRSLWDLLCCISLRWDGVGGWGRLNDFICYLISYFNFLIFDDWLNDWVLAVAFPVSFSPLRVRTAHSCH